MQQIAEWLAKIGLERYAQAFIDNDIDVEVLRYLGCGSRKDRRLIGASASCSSVALLASARSMRSMAK